MKTRKQGSGSSDELFDEDDIICNYTSEQAEEDGILIDLTKINPSWKEGMFNYATARLLSKGYLVAEKANLPNLVDILRQCWLIVKNKTNNFKQFDYFFCGKVELPNGDMQEVYIEQNETGKFTIMLPEDH